MKLSLLVKALGLQVRSGEHKLETEVTGGYTGDLLSDVMANSREGDLWITRQVHQNIVAVASLKDLAGIVLVHGAEPANDTLEKALKEDIPLMITELSGFDVVGKLYDLISVKAPKSDKHP
jgi:hypothetical protein